MRKIFLLIELLFCSVGFALAQSNPVDSLAAVYDKMYGLDVLLNNGRKYFPENNPVKGYPYWRSDKSIEGQVDIAGRSFQHQAMQYNLYKQEFVLNYVDYNAQSQQIILNASAVDTIHLDEVKFVKNKFSEIEQPFIQLIHEGKIGCYVAWFKLMQFNQTGANTGYVYTAERKNYYLRNEQNRIVRFHSKSSLLSAFEKEDRAAVKKYLAVNSVHFKGIKDDELKRLIKYCEEIE